MVILQIIEATENVLRNFLTALVFITFTLLVYVDNVRNLIINQCREVNFDSKLVSSKMLGFLKHRHPFQ